MIYFIQEGTSGPIKIGYTNGRPEQRLGDLQTSNHRKLSILAVTDGTLSDEATLHNKFKACRLQGEWFKPSEELINHILTVPEIKLSTTVSLVDNLNRLESTLIKKALDTAKTKNEAAKLLGISFRSLRYRINKLDLD